MHNPVDVSVLISTYNRLAVLRQTLEQLRDQQLGDLRWEVIVVDNGSTDATAAVLARAAEQLPLVALEQPIPGKNRALNLALTRARGTLYVFTDDDVIPRADWLAQLWAAAERWPDDSVFGGRITPRFPESAPAWIGEIHPSLPTTFFSLYAPAETESPVRRTPVGPNLAIRAEVFADRRFREDIGPAGADYAMGSETELLVRLRDEGYRFIYVPSAHVEHVIQPEQTTLAWMYGRAFRAGRGRARLRMQATVKDPQLLGAPRWMWRRALQAWVRHAMNRMRGDKTRFESGRQLHELRGQIFEHRKIAHERAQSTQSESAG